MDQEEEEEEDIWDVFGSESSESVKEFPDVASGDNKKKSGFDHAVNNNNANFEVFEQEEGCKNRPSRGKGLRSLKSFACGDEILREQATICVPNEHAATSLRKAQILHAHAVQNAYDNLSPTEQRAVMDLSNCGKYYCNNDSNNGDQQLQGIFHTNSYRLSGDDDGIQKDSGLFLTVARINHSCRPNVSHCWRPDLQRFLIFACRPIAKGEELLASYLPLMLVGDGFGSSGSALGGDDDISAQCLDTRGRRKFLRDRFAFHCLCEMCVENNTLGGDDQMTRIAHLLHKTIPDLVMYGQYGKAIKAVDRSLDLLSTQGLTGGIYTRSLLQHGYQIATRSANPQLALSYLERQLVAVTESQGAGCPETVRIEALIAQGKVALMSI